MVSALVSTRLSPVGRKVTRSSRLTLSFITVTLFSWVLLMGAVGLGTRTTSFRFLHPLSRQLLLDYSSRPGGDFAPLTARFISQALGPEALFSLPGSRASGSGLPGSTSSAMPERVVLEHAFNNDNFRDAFELWSIPFTAKTNTSGASREAGEPESCSPVGGSVWYRYRPDSNISLAANTFGSDHATTLAVFTGEQLQDLRQLACHSDAIGNARVTFTGRADTTYYFQINAPVGGGRLWFNLEYLGNITRASVSSQGTQADHLSRIAYPSDNGRWIVFTSLATNLDPGWRAPSWYFPFIGRVADWPGCRDTAALGLTGDMVMPFTRPCIDQVYVRDRLTHRTTLISVSTAGELANGYSMQGSDISADGRHVLFFSDAANLVDHDTNGNMFGGGGDDGFVRDRDTDGNGIFDEPGGVRTTRVTVSTQGKEADLGTLGGGMSPNGRHVVFMSLATNLVPNDNNGSLDTFLHDRDADGDGIFDEPEAITTERVGVGNRGEEAIGGTLQNGFSRDARYIVFRSAADNLVDGDTNGKIDTFVRDRVAGTTERISLTWDGQQQNGDSASSTAGVQWCISDDGRYLVFLSAATNLVREPDTNNAFDLFVRDRVKGDTRRVSVAWDGAQANTGEYRFENPHHLIPQAYILAATKGPSSATGHSISPDGRYVLFSSPASNLVPGDTNGFEDVFLRDVIEQTTIRVSVSAAGEEGNLWSTAPRLSEDGRFVAFSSLASNLVPGDSNETIDVFVRELGGPWGRSGWH